MSKIFVGSVGASLLDDDVGAVEDDKETLDDDLSFWKLEELIETIELLDFGLLELETIF